jgi:hypothetical protein
MAFPGARSDPRPTPLSEYHAVRRVAHNLMQSATNPPSIWLSHSFRRQTKRNAAAWVLAGLDDSRWYVITHFSTGSSSAIFLHDETSGYHRHDGSTSAAGDSGQLHWETRAGLETVLNYVQVSQRNTVEQYALWYSTSRLISSQSRIIRNQNRYRYVTRGGLTA